MSFRMLALSLSPSLHQCSIYLLHLSGRFRSFSFLARSHFFNMKEGAPSLKLSCNNSDSLCSPTTHGDFGQCLIGIHLPECGSEHLIGTTRWDPWRLSILPTAWTGNLREAIIPAVFGPGRIFLIDLFLMRVKERKKSLLQDNHQQRKKMIMIVKTPGSQMGSSAAAEGGGEERGGGRGESGERSGMLLESTAPTRRSRSRESVALNEAPRVSP